jgi:HAD superfamily hydrolase (TIGR01549 family)
VRIPIFDLDGTLVDTDEALVAPFLALGVRREDITFGHVLADECDRLGIDVESYLAHYDDGASRPFDGIEEMLGQFDRWAVCSNKHPGPASRELGRLEWQPTVALFSDAFEGPKSLPPVLEAMHARPDEVVFVGDTDHDRAIAAAAGVPFGLAAWNPRARAASGDVVLERPSEVLAFCSA